MTAEKSRPAGDRAAFTEIDGDQTSTKVEVTAQLRRRRDAARPAGGVAGWLLGSVAAALVAAVDQLGAGRLAFRSSKARATTQDGGVHLHYGNTVGELMAAVHSGCGRPYRLHVTALDLRGGGRRG